MTDYTPETRNERTARRIVSGAWIVLAAVALATISCKPGLSPADDSPMTVSIGEPWDPFVAPNTIWVQGDDAKTTYTFGLNEMVFAQANVETGEIRVLVTPSPTPVPRERIEHDVTRTEKTTLEQLRVEKADAERAIARAEEIVRRERKRLFRLDAEIAALDAALPSPTPSPTASPSPTKGGR